MGTISTATERWSLTDWAPCERAEAWAEVVCQTHLPWHLDAPGHDGPVFEAAVARQRVADIDLVHASCGPCSGARRTAELRATRGDFVGVLFVKSGDEVVAQDHREAVLHGGDVVLWDSSQPARFQVRTPLTKCTLLVPRTRLAEALPELERRSAIGVRPSPFAARLLSAHLRAIGITPPASPREAQAAADIAVDLVMTCIDSLRGPRPSSLLAALAPAVERYVSQHLGDPGLSPARIAAAHCVSLRTLYAAFEQRGDTVADYVRRRRLERCYDDLLHDLGSPVAEIGARWGFPSGSHFSRAFKRRYDETPSEVRARAR